MYMKYFPGIARQETSGNFTQLRSFEANMLNYFQMAFSMRLSPPQRLKGSFVRKESTEKVSAGVKVGGIFRFTCLPSHRTAEILESLQLIG